MGNPDSFATCSTGRAAGCRAARQSIASRSPTTEPTASVECRKDKDVIDETPAAYKDIDAVMAAQRDLVEIAYTLKQVLCVKG